MKDFINSQINIAELKADQQLETLRQKYQKMAFEDAIRCTSPGKSSMDNKLLLLTYKRC